MSRVKLFILISVMVPLLAACGDSARKDAEESEVQLSGVELEVVTTFAGNDGNAQNYQEFCRKWEKETGNVIADRSVLSDETFKMRVLNDFATGSEPDVLFFFNGADANEFIRAGRVVSLEKIRGEYPEFAANLSIEKIPTSQVDGKAYAIPVNGYWEAMYVNTTVLEKSGVEMPGADYTWEQFLKDCKKIKAKGYIPIAAALGNIPHYWWEFAIFNHTAPENHMVIPEGVTDANGQNWVAGINDIKDLYKAGYFPENTTTATDDETFTMFMEGEAAFLLDGSWKLGSIVQNCQTDPDNATTLDEGKLEQYAVTFAPGSGDRKATDLIGGMSMGYYITEKAWKDPKTREAAVSFVAYMTSDEVTPVFSQHTSNVLKQTSADTADTYNSLQLSALRMLENCTSLTDAVQDSFQGECRELMFDKMPDILNGQASVEEAVAEGLQIYHEEH